LDYVRAKLEHKRLLTIQKSIKSFLHNKSESERNFSSKIIASKYKCYVVRSFVEGKLKFIVANWKLDLFLNINANQIQRVFRGHQSRTNIFDMELEKARQARISQINTKIIQNMHEFESVILKEIELHKKLEEQTKIDEMLENKSFLVSTKANAGVYNGINKRFEEKILQNAKLTARKKFSERSKIYKGLNMRIKLEKDEISRRKRAITNKRVQRTQERFKDRPLSSKILTRKFDDNKILTEKGFNPQRPYKTLKYNGLNKQNSNFSAFEPYRDPVVCFRNFDKNKWVNKNSDFCSIVPRIDIFE